MNVLVRLAWLPIPLLLFAMVVLWIAGSTATYDPPHPMMALNLLFTLPVSLLVAYQAGRGFLLRGNPKLLWFGCGMLFWGSAGSVGGALLSHSPNAAVAIHNTLVWLAAACHLVGILLAPRQRTGTRWPEPWLVGSYIGTLFVVTAVVLTTLSGEMPTFFVQGEGGTLFRQIVLGSAITMLASTAILLRGGNGRGISSTFRYWYALGLLLIAVGLFGVMIQSTVGSALGWIGRIAQHFGSAYLMVGVIVALRENRDWGRSLEIALDEARQRFEELIDLAGDGIVVHELISATASGHFLQVNPAICALLGYTAREMRELTPLDIIAPEDRPHVAEDTQMLHRGELLRHEKTLIARDGRRVPVEINTRQYHHRGRAMVISVIRDVTERKRTEAALRERTDRYELVLAGAQDAIWDWDVTNKRVLFSPQWKMMRGYAENEVGDREEEWSTGIHPDDAPRVFTRLQECFDGNTPVFAEEYRIRCKDGSWKWIFARGIVKRDATGRVVRMAGSENDITERKRAEEALSESEARLRVFIQHAPAALAMFDHEMRYLYVSNRWLIDYGLGDRDLRGVSHYDVFPEISEAWKEVHRRGLAGEVVRSEGEIFERADGSVQWVRWEIRPWHNAQRSVGGIVIFTEDITERKRAEELLKAERDRFTRIAATVPGVICSFRLGPDGSDARFPYASPAIRDLYGLRLEELAESAAPLWAMVHPDDLDHLDAGIAASARTMTPWRDEFRVLHPTKGEIWVEGHSMPVREPDGGILWHGYLQDITERKGAEATLRAALEEQEALLREVHHRVKNNLATVIDLLELQRESLPDPPTAARLAEVRDRIRSMALIHEMLYRSGNLSRVDFRGYLQALVGHLRDSLDPRAVTRIRVAAPEIEMNLDTAIPCGLIVNELVTNALKHAFPEGFGPETDAREIAVAITRDGAVYTLTVTDNGIGLPAGLDWTTTRTLGLRLVRVLGQHQLQGQLAFDSVPGTRFSLRFSPR